MNRVHEKYFFVIQEIRSARLSGNLALISGFKPNTAIPELDRHGIPLEEEPLEQRAAIVARIDYDKDSEEYDIKPFACLSATRMAEEMLFNPGTLELSEKSHQVFDAVIDSLVNSLVQVECNQRLNGVNVVIGNSSYTLFIPEANSMEYFSL